MKRSRIPAGDFKVRGGFLTYSAESVSVAPTENTRTLEYFMLTAKISRRIAFTQRVLIKVNVIESRVKMITLLRVFQDGLKSASIVLGNRLAKVEAAPNLSQKIIDAIGRVANASVGTERNRNFSINNTKKIQ